MNNPDMMMNMMKQNLGGFIPQVCTVCCSAYLLLWLRILTCVSVATVSAASLTVCMDTPPADPHGNLRQLLLLWLHPGQNPFSAQPFFPLDASGLHGFHHLYKYKSP